MMRTHALIDIIISLPNKATIVTTVDKNVSHRPVCDEKQKI
jgi:hypothetical protein